MNKILWSKNHRYIMSISNSLDGYFYVKVYECSKPRVDLKIFGSLAHDYAWAFNEALKQLK